jgi:ubiquitin-conjugating enzyme E2 O
VPSLGEIDSDLEVNAKRQEMARWVCSYNNADDSLAERYAQNPSAYNVLLPAGNTGDVDWFGEVAELGLNGSVGVDVPSGIRKRVPIKQIILLNEILPEGIEPQGGQDDASMASDDSWETVGDDRPVGAEDVEEDDDGDKIMTDVENDEVDDAVGGSSPVKAFTAPVNHDHSTLVDDEHWKPFDILEEAPVDHAYIKEPRLAASSKAFYSRLQKEHRALASSLPGRLLA